MNDEAAGFAGGLDRCLFDLRYGRFELFTGGGADGDEAGVAEDAVTARKICFLLQYVLVFGGLLSVFDLPDLLPLRGVRDVFDLLLPDVPGGLVGPDRGAQE